MNDRDIARQMGRECIAFRVRRASRMITRVYDECLAGAGLTATQLTVLTAVYNRPDLKVVELAEELGFEPSSLSRALTALAQKKWIKRAASNSHREKFFELTERGLAKLREGHRAWEQAQAQAKRSMGAEPLAALLTGVDAARSMQLHER